MPVSTFRKSPFPTLREFPYEVRRWCIELQERVSNFTTQLESVLNLSTEAAWIPYSSWSPAVVQSVAITETVHVATYQVDRGRCKGNARIGIGSAGTAGNTITVTLPVPVHPDMLSGNLTPIGTFRGADVSVTANGRVGHLFTNAGSSTTARLASPAGLWGNSDPNFALASGDEIYLMLDYPVEL